MTKMTDAREDRRRAVEDVLAMLNDSDVCLRMIELQNRFMRERYNNKVNTGAVDEEITKVRRNISIVRAEVSQFWSDGQASGWPTE